jgi:hypothetical protein
VHAFNDAGGFDRPVGGELRNPAQVRRMKCAADPYLPVTFPPGIVQSTRTVEEGHKQQRCREQRGVEPVQGREPQRGRPSLAAAGGKEDENQNRDGLLESSRTYSGRTINIGFCRRGTLTNQLGSVIAV